MTKIQEEPKLLNQLTHYSGLPIMFLGRQFTLNVVSDYTTYYFSGSLGSVILYSQIHDVYSILFNKTASGNSPYMRADEITTIAKAIISYDEVKASKFSEESLPEGVSMESIKAIRDCCDDSVILDELAKKGDLKEFANKLTTACRISRGAHFRGLAIHSDNISTESQILLRFQHSSFAGLCGGATVSTLATKSSHIKKILGEELSNALVYALLQSVFKSTGGGLLMFSDVVQTEGRTISRLFDTLPIFKEVIKDIGVLETNPKTSNTMRLYVLKRSDLDGPEFTEKIFKTKQLEEV